jgi:hypothetical protein
MKRRTFLAASAALPIVGVARGKHVRSVPMQPVPIKCSMANARNGAAHFTAITRDWAGRDYERCQLCPVHLCQARHYDQPRCLIAVPALIPDDQAKMFNLAEWMKEKGIS